MREMIAQNSRSWRLLCECVAVVSRGGMDLSWQDQEPRPKCDSKCEGLERRMRKAQSEQRDLPQALNRCSFPSERSTSNDPTETICVGKWHGHFRPFCARNSIKSSKTDTRVICVKARLDNLCHMDLATGERPERTVRSVGRSG